MAIDYFLASAIVYLGLMIGIVLILLAPEEQKPGKKYFIQIQKILMTVMSTLVLLSLNINLILLLFFIIIIILLIYGKEKSQENSSFVYFVLGLKFVYASTILNLFVIQSILIFLYGIPTASLIYNMKNKNYFDIFVKHLWFFVPVIIFYFIPFTISLSLS